MVTVYFLQQNEEYGGLHQVIGQRDFSDMSEEEVLKSAQYYASVLTDVLGKPTYYSLEKNGRMVIDLESERV